MNWSKEEQLREACSKDRFDEVRGLIEEGVDVDSKDEIGRTPLMWAAYKGHVEIIRLLLDHGADVNNRTYGDYYIALHWAASYGKDESVKLLIERGANLHVVNNNGSTALNEAKRRKTVAIILKAMSSIKGKNDC